MAIMICLVIVALIALVAGVATMTANSAEAIAKSIAEIETAKAMQQQALATTKAVSALGAVTVMDKVTQILVVVLLLAVIVLVGYIYYQNAKMRVIKTQVVATPQAGKWVSGPNAGWKKVGDGQQPAQISQPISMQDAMAMAAMSVMAIVIQQMRPAQPPALPAAPAPIQQQTTAPYMIDTDIAASYFGGLVSVEPANSEWESFVR